MNILILNRDLNVGGGVTYIRGLCSVLRSRGHRVFIIAGPGPMASALSRSCDGLWPVPLFSPLQRPWLRHVVRKHRIDLVNIHSRTPARMAFPICEQAGIPMVVTAHGPVYGRRLELLKPIYARAAAFIVMNEQNAAYYLGVGVPPERLHLSRLLVDWSDAPQRPPRPAHAFMYCSRLSGLKGPRAEAWLRAMALLPPDPARRIAVIGSGSYRRRLQDVASSLGLEVEFRGSAPDAARHFSECDVLAGAGFVAVEGLRAGCGVVGIGFEGAFGAVTPENFEQALASNFGDNAYQELDSSPRFIADSLQTAMGLVESGQASCVADLARAQCSYDVLGDSLTGLFERIARAEDFRQLTGACV